MTTFSTFSTLSARAIVIVLDGAGIGELPDAASYGDGGSNTIGHVAERVRLAIPTLRALGLGRVVALGENVERTSSGDSQPNAIGNVRSAHGRMAEASPGKDSVTGHWEMMGLVLERPFPVFPNGFPPDMIAEFSRRCGRAVLGNTVASGTDIIDRLGAEHLRTGSLIVYTSADSVFQIAAHEDVVPLPELYRACQTAYELAVIEHGVGRVIARPFVGTPGAFERTAHRRDYTRPPIADTLLDRLVAKGREVIAIGKIEDLFAGRGVSRAIHTASDEEGMEATRRSVASEAPAGSFVFANLVDFDTRYGHRNDVEGYARNLECFDRQLEQLLPQLRESDILVVTGDHGNDPTDASTDHSREHVPVLVAGARIKRGVDLGTRTTFADLGQTLAEFYGVPALAHGTSFLGDIIEP